MELGLGIAYASLLGMALFPIYIGSYLSLNQKATETLSTQHAWSFPFVGSAVLFGLYLLFKLVPKEYINLLLTLHFMFLGVGALTATLSPWIESLLPSPKKAKPFISFTPFWRGGQEKTDFGQDMLLFLTVLVALASAQHHHGCCFPRAFEAEAFGHHPNMSFFETISYDYERLALRVDRFDHHDRQRHHFTRFEETRGGVHYVIHVEGSTCKVETRKDPIRELCVPETHREERHVLVGGFLEATWYGFRTPTFQDWVLVSRHHCNPIEGVFFEHHDHVRTFEGRVDFFNVKHGIGNPVIFEIPPFCKL